MFMGQSSTSFMETIIAIYKFFVNISIQLGFEFLNISTFITPIKYFFLSLLMNSVSKLAFKIRRFPEKLLLLALYKSF